MALALIVTSDVAVQSLIRGVLESQGHASFTANTLAEALRTLKSSPTQLVIADLYMPEENGMEFVRTIRRDFAQIKITVLYSGRLNEEVMLRADQLLGAHGTIPQPVTIGKTVSVVKQLVSAS